MERPILVCGLDALGIAVIRRLVARGVDVRALAAAPGEAASYAHELKRLGVQVCVGVARSEGELEAAGLHEARALVLTADDDAENVDAALTARRLNPTVPIVARIFDPSLGSYLQESEAGLTILSVSGLASPRFADLAEKVALPIGAGRSIRRRSRSRAGGRRRVDPILVRLAIVTSLVVVFSMWFYSRALELTPFDAFYFVVESVTNTGFGDVPMRAAGTGSKVLTIALMIGGAGLLGLVYALITGWFVARRLDVLQGRVPERGSDHVVIAGVGNVGFRVAQLLAAAGRKVVVIEREGDSVNAAQLRAEGHHVIVGDAGHDGSLELAAVDRASVVMALTDSDAVNLRMALATRNRNEEVPIVLRLLSPELSEHLHGKKGITTVSPIAVASEHIAAAAVAESR